MNSPKKLKPQQKPQQKVLFQSAVGLAIILAAILLFRVDTEGPNQMDAPQEIVQEIPQLEEESPILNEQEAEIKNATEQEEINTAPVSTPTLKQAVAAQATQTKRVRPKPAQTTSSATWGNIDFSFDTKGAMLKWDMKALLFADEFEIERSSDKKTFENLGTKPARDLESYNFHDESLDFLGMPRVYYRLKMKGLDGNSFYSPLKKVDIPLELGLYGRVEVQKEKISCTYAADTWGEIELSIENEQGKVLFTDKVKVGPDSQKKYVKTDNWGKGSYTLWIKNAETEFQTEFILKG